MEYKAGSGNYVWNILPEHVQKYGSAFLNSGGGTLCVGVADSGNCAIFSVYIIIYIIDE